MIQYAAKHIFGSVACCKPGLWGKRIGHSYMYCINNFQKLVYFLSRYGWPCPYPCSVVPVFDLLFPHLLRQSNLVSWIVSLKLSLIVMAMHTCDRICMFLQTMPANISQSQWYSCLSYIHSDTLKNSSSRNVTPLQKVGNFVDTL